MNSIFIILNNASNDVAFAAQLSEDENMAEVQNALGILVGKAKGSPAGALKNLAVNQGKYVFMNRESFLVIASTGDMPADAAKKIVKKVGIQFSTRFKEQLENFGGDVAVFEPFAEDLPGLLSGGDEGSSVPAVAGRPAPEVPIAPAIPMVAAPRPGVAPEAGNAEEVTEEGGDSWGGDEPAAPSLDSLPKTFQAAAARVQMTAMPDAQTDGPMVPAAKRDSYPEGIPEYSRDEILWNESQAVMKEYSGDFVDGDISILDLFLSISVVHHYEIVINFSNYPERPKIEISDSLARDLGKPYDEYSYLMRNWDPLIPPHILEVFQEFEAILVKLKSQGKLGQTAEMPTNMLPKMDELVLPEYQPPVELDLSPNLAPTAGGEAAPRPGRQGGQPSDAAPAPASGGGLFEGGRDLYLLNEKTSKLDEAGVLDQGGVQIGVIKKKQLPNGQVLQFWPSPEGIGMVAFFKQEEGKSFVDLMLPGNQMLGRIEKPANVKKGPFIFESTPGSPELTAVGKYGNNSYDIVAAANPKQPIAFVRKGSEFKKVVAPGKVNLGSSFAVKVVDAGVDRRKLLALVTILDALVNQ